MSQKGSPRIWRFKLVHLLLLVAAAAIVFAIYENVRPNYARHLRTAREQVGEPDFTTTSAECNRRIVCADGDEFYLYFFSTNGRRSRSRYMMTVVTIPDGAQYYKIEPFVYKRSRAISDPREEDEPGWERKLPVSQQQELYLLNHAEDLKSLGKGLERFDWQRAK